MREAGTESWRFAHDMDENLHALLYVRDCLGLELSGQGVPPHLVGEVPDHSAVLDVDGRREASVGWSDWWTRAVSMSAKNQFDPQGIPTADWLRSIAERHGRVADPPGWSSLAGHPALREAARMLFTEGCSWASTARQPFLPPAHKDVFGWRIVRDTAEAVAADHHVGTGAIDGCALVLMVGGRWWEVISPGVALCSVEAALDPVTASTVLHQIFDSHLAS